MMRAGLPVIVVAAVAAPAAVHAEDDGLEALRHDLDMLGRRVDRIVPRVARLSGWLDVGAFAASGDGSGVRSDLLHEHLPEYDGRIPASWVFMGDPLSTAVNSRGEPADAGGSRVTDDSIDSEGHASFLVSSLTLRLVSAVTGRLAVIGEVDFLPRRADAVEVRLAYAEYALGIGRTTVNMYAGKTYSALGIEYRTQDAPSRLGVTPSLLCRYICGYPVGAGAWGRFMDRSLFVNLAITNGSHFARLSDEQDLDADGGKTVAGRVAWRFPVREGIEVGVSGAVGGQDGVDGTPPLQWHVGGDVAAELDDVVIHGEVVRGRAPGREDPEAVMSGLRCAGAPCVDYTAAYVLAGWRIVNWATPYVRVEWRDAIHAFGAEFVYVTSVARATAGCRFELGAHVIAKVEYVHNRELGRLPEFDNDVVTTSLVVRY